MSNNDDFRNDALFGRRLNAIDDQELWRMLPTSARFSVYEYLVAASDRNSAGEAVMFGRSLCDGTGRLPDGTDCTARDGARGASDALQIARQVPGLREVITHPLVNTRVLTDQNIQDLWTPGADIQTADAAVLERVETMEHQLHRIGRHMTRTEGSVYARSLIVRWMLLFELMYHVPVTEASSFTEFSSWISVYEWLYVAALSLLTQAGSLAWSGLLIVEAMLREHALRRVVNVTTHDYATCLAWAPYQYTCWIERVREMVWLQPHYKEIIAKGLRSKSDDLDVFWWAAIILCLGVGVILTVISAWTIRRVRAWRVARQLSHYVSPDSEPPAKTDPEIAHKQIVTLMQNGVRKMCPVDMFEMSQKGSEVCESRHVPGLLQLIKINNDQTICIGLAFRYIDYLVTVEHNITALESSPGVNYVVPFVEKNDRCVFDVDRHIELTSDVIAADIVPTSMKGLLDLAIIPLGNKSFSKLGVASIQTTSAVWGTPIAVVGLTTNGKNVLHRAVGSISKTPDEPLYKVYYNASTAKGWSGAPVLVKRKVAAIHVGTNGKTNFGLNFAVVTHVLRKFTEAGLEANYYYADSYSSSSRDEEFSESFRDRDGNEADYDDLGMEGEIDLGYLTRSSRTGKVGFSSRANVDSWMNWKSSSGRNWADDDYNDEPSHIDIGRGLESNNQPMPTGESRLQAKILTADQTVVAMKPPSPKRPDPFSYLDGTLDRVSTRQCLACPYFKGLPEEHDRYVDMDEAVRLGYEKGKFVWPPARNYEEAKVRSVNALSNYLKKSVHSRNTGWVPPDSIRATAISIWKDVMKPARFVTDCTGVTKEKILLQLRSNLVSGSRSPGLPFVPQFQTNAEVIAEYGEEALADLVVEKWLDGSWEKIASVNFIKLEPTKTSKIAENLDRCIQSVSLIIQLIFRCFMGDMHDALKAAQGKIPIMMGWCPTNPGHADLAVNRLVGTAKNRDKGEILCYDGQAFEYTSHMEWNYKDVTACMSSLFVPGRNTDETWPKFLADFFRFMDSVGRTGIHCADGTLISKAVAWILSSGRYDTYVRNSSTGMYNDIVAKLLAGLSVDQIKRALLRAIFGGDDNCQYLSGDYDVKKFLAQFPLMGFPVHDVSITKPMQGFEFFSWKFTFDGHLMPVFIPTRFTKHLENFLACKHEFRGDALRCLMMIWVHDEEKFNFFRDIFLKGNAAEPETYRLDLVVDRLEFLNYVRGIECGSNAILTEDAREELGLCESS